MYYTRDGEVRAAGAEAQRADMKAKARKERLVLAEWYVLLSLRIVN